MRRSDLTVILVEQNASSALRIAHHAVVLHVGKAVANDTAANVAADDEPPPVLPRIGGVMDPFLTSRIVSDILGGLTNGVTYGMVALSLVLIWRSTGILNFAQGAMPMFATYVGFALLSYHWGYWPCVVVCVIAGLRPRWTHRAASRSRVCTGNRRSIRSSSWWDSSSCSKQSPPPSGRRRREVCPVPSRPSTGISPASRCRCRPTRVYEIATALVVMIAVAALFRFTKLGLQLRASALAPEVSRLLGVRVGRLLTLGWMLATVVGVITTVLVAGGGFFSGLTPQVMDGIFAYGFIAAAIGGLESPVGRDRRRRRTRYRQSIRR